MKYSIQYLLRLIILKPLNSLAALQKDGRIWGLYYLAIIPVWAVIYTMVPNGFHDSAMKYEQSTLNDNIKAASQFCQYLKQHIAGDNSYPFTINGAKATISFSPKYLSCDSVFRFTQDKLPHITVKMNFDFSPESKTIDGSAFPVEGQIVSEIVINHGPSQILEKSLFNKELKNTFGDSDEYLNFNIYKSYIRSLIFRHNDEISPNGSQNLAPSAEILRTPRIYHNAEEMRTVLKNFKNYYQYILQYGVEIASYEEATKLGRNDISEIKNTIPQHRTEAAYYLNQFSKDQSGNTSMASGNIWRMLYFSAETVTTLGMGDILPVSVLSRLLVACEAVFGVYCIGRFLNALAKTTK